MKMVGLPRDGDIYITINKLANHSKIHIFVYLSLYVHHTILANLSLKCCQSILTVISVFSQYNNH